MKKKSSSSKAIAYSFQPDIQACGPEQQNSLKQHYRTSQWLDLIFFLSLLSGFLYNTRAVVHGEKKKLCGEETQSVGR